MAKRRQGRTFTAAESAEVWDRWQRGEGINLIGRIIGRGHTAVFAHLKPHGGIRPAPRHRSAQDARRGTRRLSSPKQVTCNGCDGRLSAIQPKCERATILSACEEGAEEVLSAKFCRSSARPRPAGAFISLNLSPRSFGCR